MRLAKWLGCAAWAGSWYLMYLEVTRWRHVKPSLAFNSDPIPGTDIRALTGRKHRSLAGQAAAVHDGNKPPRQQGMI
jgi:hypothetical protein